MLGGICRVADRTPWPMTYAVYGPHTPCSDGTGGYGRLRRRRWVTLTWGFQTSRTAIRSGCSWLGGSRCRDWPTGSVERCGDRLTPAAEWFTLLPTLRGA